MQQDRLILSITQLNAEVSRLLTQGLPALWAEGEISNFVRHTSGHLYFTLKDAGAQIRCAMFKGRATTLKLIPKNGAKVVVRGKVGLYEPRGDYQMVIEHMEDAGIGALQRQFEALKHTLQARGWFDTARKQTLPAFPRQIGVISSPTGAAIRDILHVLKRRCPHIPVLVYPVAVQGDGAKEQIVQAIQQAGADRRCDVLIVARGGGSIEDLWAFNEEIVAQAIVACPIPIVSGVGHEIDFTIADFVADLRAPTPSAAAELVSPDAAVLHQQLQRLLKQLQQRQYHRLRLASEHCQRLQQRLANQRPSRRLQQKAQRLDELDMRLRAAMQRKQEAAAQTFTHWQTRWQQQSPLRAIHLQQEQLVRWHNRLHQRVQQCIGKSHDRLQIQAGKLHALSPLATLERGYSIVRQPQTQRVVRNINTLRLGDTVLTQLADGEFESIVTKLQSTGKP